MPHAHCKDRSLKTCDHLSRGMCDPSGTPCLARSRSSSSLLIGISGSAKNAAAASTCTQIPLSVPASLSVRTQHQMGNALHAKTLVSALFKATSCSTPCLQHSFMQMVKGAFSSLIARSGSQAGLTSAALKALREESTACTSASFSAGTCSCTLKALEKPMSSMMAGAEDVPACRMSRLRRECAAPLAAHAWCLAEAPHPDLS